MCENNLVVLSGTHGSGKTTFIGSLLGELRKRQQTFAHLGEVARLCPHTIGAKSTSVAQQWIFFHQALVETMARYLSVPVILDRCVVDHYAYFCHWVPDTHISLTTFAANYFSVFQFPARSEFLISDGLRPTDQKFQQKISDSIHDVHQRYSEHYKCSIIDPLQSETLERVALSVSQCSHALVDHVGDYQVMVSELRNRLPFAVEIEETQIVEVISKVFSLEDSINCRMAIQNLPLALKDRWTSIVQGYPDQ